MKQQKKTALIPAPQQAALTKALTLKGEIVAYHQAATAAAEEAMENAFQCGRLLEEVKGVLKADKSTQFGKWVEQFCGFSSSSAYSYCKLFTDLRELTKFQRAGIFNRYNSQRAVAAFLTDQRKTADPIQSAPPASVDPAPVVSVPTSPPPASPSATVPSLDDDACDGSGGGGEDPLYFPEGPVADLGTPDEWQDEKPKKGKKPPVSGPDTKALYKEWDRAIGPLVRLVDRIAGQVNGKHGEHHKTVHEHLNCATEEMMEWLKVGK